MLHCICAQRGRVVSRFVISVWSPSNCMLALAQTHSHNALVHLSYTRVFPCWWRGEIYNILVAVRSLAGVTAEEWDEQNMWPCCSLTRRLCRRVFNAPNVVWHMRFWTIQCIRKPATHIRSLIRFAYVTGKNAFQHIQRHVAGTHSRVLPTSPAILINIEHISAIIACILGRIEERNSMLFVWRQCDTAMWIRNCNWNRSHERDDVHKCKEMRSIRSQCHADESPPLGARCASVSVWVPSVDSALHECRTASVAS